MKKTKSFQDLVVFLAEKHALEEADVKKAILLVFRQMIDELLQSLRVSIVNFGTFIVKHYKEKKDIHSISGKLMTVAEKYYLKCKFSQSFSKKY